MMQSEEVPSGVLPVNSKHAVVQRVFKKSLVWRKSTFSRSQLNMTSFRCSSPVLKPDTRLPQKKSGHLSQNSKSSGKIKRKKRPLVDVFCHTRVNCCDFRRLLSSGGASFAPGHQHSWSRPCPFGATLDKKP